MAELIIVRHGPTDSPGCLNGRTNVGLACRPDAVSFIPAEVWVSPAHRAVETAIGMFGDVPFHPDPRLWEQDFGAWDGLPFSELPNVGDLDKQALCGLKAEGGESFADMVARAQPALDDAAARAVAIKGPLVIVAHAGTVRAALAMALENLPAALAFDVGHLRATRFRCFEGGLSVLSVNEVLA